MKIEHILSGKGKIFTFAVDDDGEILKVFNKMP